MIIRYFLCALKPLSEKRKSLSEKLIRFVSNTVPRTDGQFIPIHRSAFKIYENCLDILLTKHHTARLVAIV